MLLPMTKQTNINKINQIKKQFWPIQNYVLTSGTYFTQQKMQKEKIWGKN